jgi:hypothetical protein
MSATTGLDPYIRNPYLFRTRCNCCVETYIQTVAEIREEVREALRILRDALCAPFVADNITTAATILHYTISLLTPDGRNNVFAVHARYILSGHGGDAAAHVAGLLQFNINNYL